MPRSWDHQLRLLTPEEKADSAQHRYTSQECSTSGCKNESTHIACYSYITGRRGRESRAGKHLCSGHAAKFAKKYGIEYIGPDPCPLTKDTRRPLTECAICRKKRRVTHVVPKGLQLFWPHGWLKDNRTPFEPGTILCSWERVRITKDLARQLGLENYIQEQLELVDVYIDTVLQKFEETKA